MAAVNVHLGHGDGTEPAIVPDVTGVGPLGVARRSARINSSKDGVDWTSGIGSRHAPDQHSNLLDGTAKAQLPMLLTKHHLSSGRLARVCKLDKSLSNIWLVGFDSDDIKAAQQQDPDISPILAWVEDGRRPDKIELAPCGAETKNIVAQWTLLSLRDGILYRETKKRQTGEICYQLVVPLCLRTMILEQLHNLRIVGHL